MAPRKKKAKTTPTWYPGTAALLLRCFTAAYLAFLGLAAYYFSTMEHRRSLNFMQAIPFWDKYFHFCATGTLSFFLNLILSFRVWRIGRLPFLWGTWIVIAMAMSEEFSQSFIPGRVFDIWDIAAASAGAIVFGRLAMFIYSKEFRQPILRRLRWLVRQSTQHGWNKIKPESSDKR
jgi:polysaccharide biosynthesis protein VpsQ